MVCTTSEPVYYTVGTVPPKGCFMCWLLLWSSDAHYSAGCHQGVCARAPSLCVVCRVCVIVIVKSAVSEELLRQSIRAFITNSVAIDSGVPSSPVSLAAVPCTRSRQKSVCVCDYSFGSRAMRDEKPVIVQHIAPR